MYPKCPVSREHESSPVNKGSEARAYRGGVRKQRGERQQPRQLHDRAFAGEPSRCLRCLHRVREVGGEGGGGQKLLLLLPSAFGVLGSRSNFRARSPSARPSVLWSGFLIHGFTSCSREPSNAVTSSRFIDMQLLRVLMELLQYRQRLIRKAVFENALNDSAAIRIEDCCCHRAEVSVAVATYPVPGEDRANGTHLSLKGVDDEVQRMRLNTLDAFLHHVVTVLVLYALQNMAVQLPHHLTLQGGQRRRKRKSKRRGTLPKPPSVAPNVAPREEEACWLKPKEADPGPC
ncbi:hypothetical protein EYF80_004005 [Liparis tanakae]|uniref:Uncharacterized protein n=1 Tax=Liparis tanakae TaxID=230148 RepID=A0A4Z2J7T7_9TELE|nr:hypothetical protein EYF80_004005 [Liparis tanakae]